MFALFLLLILPPATRSVNAQSDEEREVLELFYAEKDLVVSTTHYPKPISQVSENVTIITAKEIEAMNAYTVAEVLDRVPGIFVNFSREFGATSLINIQGSEDRHVLVLLDGIRWNFLGGGNAETNTIPVGIVNRIEIIKGPASSAWGSSLGGVINVITKQVGTTEKPSGTVRFSFGESTSLDTSAQLAGKAADLGYYLYAGRQSSDGLLGDRDYENNRFFSKFQLPLGERTRIGASAGYSGPENNLGDYPSGDVHADSDLEAAFANLNIHSDLSTHLSFEVSGYYIRQELTLDNTLLGLFLPGNTGDLLSSNLYDEETLGGTAKFVLTVGNHTMVTGMEYGSGNLDQTISTGNLLQSYGAPANNRTDSDLSQWAVFANDTFLWGRWAITPGLRFDHNSVSGDFFSPSLGITYQLKKNTVLRATIARGFHYPPLAYADGGGLFLDPNPSLDAEEVWSYEAGVETTIGHAVWLKANLFLHDQDKTITGVSGGGGPPAFNDIYVNSKAIKRRGVEVEIETKPVCNLTMHAGGAYIHIDPPTDTGSTERWTGSVAFSYDDRESIYAELHGKYTDWDAEPIFQSQKDMIWEFHFRKKVSVLPCAGTTFFFAAHNIFNGSQYINADSRNPNRWLEAGVEFSF